MWELACEESWARKNWCFWNVVLEKTLESPLDCKEIQPVHPKGDQSWVFVGRNDAKAETPLLWPPHVKSWLIGKDSDAGRDWGQEEKGTTEDEIAGWHHRLNGCEFEWTLGVGNGQGGLACCNSWGGKESDMTEWRTELNWRLNCWATLISLGWSLLSKEQRANPSSWSRCGCFIFFTLCPFCSSLGILITLWNWFWFLSRIHFLLKPYLTRVLRGFKLPALLERISFLNQEVTGMDFNVKELME